LTASGQAIHVAPLLLLAKLSKCSLTVFIFGGVVLLDLSVDDWQPATISVITMTAEPIRLCCISENSE
jgi:hypothetical protein